MCSLHFYLLHIICYILIIILVTSYEYFYIIILYTIMLVVGSNGIEPSTSRLSGVRSNHLSYEPIY